jgi:hypothetical protein
MSSGSGGSPEQRASPKVHLVGKQDRWILGRYARILTDRLGWSIGERSRTDVDVNLFWPYLLINVGNHLPKTKNAAFFTHLEETERNRSKNSKVNRWHNAAGIVDLRICMTEKYRKILVPNGPTVHVSVPIEVARFRPRKLRVGVAGKVYALSRKGENLVRRLVETKEFEVIGAGKGWPCPTKFYNWKDMPNFYQSLDIFLVTSEVEGGPVTMLEALSCGVPVVAPTGVGMVDEYTVATYQRGDFQSMLKRLRLFQIGRARRSRSVVNRTAENFAKACQSAIKLIC